MLMFSGLSGCVISLMVMGRSIPGSRVSLLLILVFILILLISTLTYNGSEKTRTNSWSRGMPPFSTVINTRSPSLNNGSPSGSSAKRVLKKLPSPLASIDEISWYSYLLDSSGFIITSLYTRISPLGNPAGSSLLLTTDVPGLPLISIPMTCPMVSVWGVKVTSRYSTTWPLTSNPKINSPWD